MRIRPGLIALAALSGAFAPRVARAQNPAWTANLIVQPFPSPFLADWKRNPTIAVLTVLYTGRSGQTFRVEAFARASGRGELGRVISPPFSFAFGPTTQLITAADILNWNTETSNQQYVTLAERSGRLPEGPIQLCARVLDQNSVQLTQTCTSVTIALPDPPRLIFPSNATTVSAVQPVFQWTPVIVPPEIGVTYRVRIVERHAQQTPRTALAANIPTFDQQIGGAPLLTYPLNGLPLESGKQYVWQISALDQTGLPIARNQGASEIWTFTLGGPSRPPGSFAGAFPDSLTVVPGVARLSGLSKATITETPFAYVLDGQATLTMLGQLSGTVQVSLSGLEVDKTSVSPAVFRGGSFTGAMPPRVTRAGVGNSFVKFTSIAFDPQNGLTVGAALALPSVTAPFSGSVHLTAAGLAGRLSTQSTGGVPLATLGSDPAALLVQEADVTLPGGNVTLSGSLRLLGQDVGCSSVSGAVNGSGNLSATVACRPQQPVSLVPGVSRFQLGLSALSGTFGADLNKGTSTYQLSAAGQLAVDAGGAPCGGSLSLTIANGGVTPGTFTPSCDGSQATADLGWISVRLSNLQLQKFAYLPGTGFDFGLQVDLAPWIPTAPDLALPSAAGVTVDKNGFSVPAIDGAVARPPVSLGGFAIQVKHVSLPAFALTWQNWQAHSAVGFSFGLDGTASFAGLPQGEPTCLANAVLSFSGARLTGGQLTASLAGQNFTPSCDVPLGAGAVFQLQRVSGGIAVALAPQVAVTTSPSVQGALVLPSFFDCPAGTDRQVALAAGLSLSPQGMFTGHVSGLSPPCPIALAAVQINVTNAALDFSAGTGGVQAAVLSGSATGKFTAGATSVNGSGSVSIDLIQGRLTSGNLTFAGPFELDLPRSPAVLALRVPGATLDNAGLHVDGRGQLLLPNNQTIAATFDQVTVNPQTVVLSGGKILFDAPFALEIGVGQGGALTWKALALGSALDVTSGIRVDLPTQLVIGANGLTASGTAGGHLIYGGKDLDGLAVTFSSDFALGLSPAAVTQGAVSFAWHGAAVGSVDARGFHPNLGALATEVIPARLGLPAANVAYLQLKDVNGVLLVSTQTVSGGVRVYTAPNVTVPLVFPALQLGRAAPPQLNVAFDVTVDPLGSGITAGTVFAQVPAGASGFDLSGAALPFAVDSVRYTAGGVSPYLAIYGAPALFGARRGSRVALQLDATGTLSGAVDVTLPQSQLIPLVSGFNGLTLSVSRVNGSFNAGLLNQSLVYDLSATGTLAVGAYTAGATVEVSDQGTKVSQLTLPTGADTLAFVDWGALRVGLSGVQIPTFAYDVLSGKWNFDLVFNAALQFPQLNSLTLPTVSGLELTPQGFTIPAINLPQLAVKPGTVAGFQVAPLAFRTARAVTYNWFTGQAPSDWGFGFDLQVGFAADAPPALQNLQLTVLNAGLTNGVFTGQVEPPALSQPIAMSWGSIRQFGGALQAVTQTVNGVARQAQGVSVTVTGQYGYPALMRCAAAPQDTSATVSVAITASGWLTGTASNVVPRCPVQVGPLSVQMTGSSLAFSVGSGAQGAELDGTAALKLAAPTTPDSVTASGTLALDLVHSKVLGGSLVLTQPFRWSLPTTAPLLQFDVTEGRIDSSGFALSGSAALMLAPGDSVLGTLNGLLLSLPDLTVKRGSLTLTNGFAIAASLGPSAGLAWKTVSRTAAPPPTGLLIAAPDTVVIDSSGFHLGGHASASLAFNGKTYGPAQLAAQFDSGFAVGISPVAVRKGRVTFITGTDTVAVVNTNGFLPGNVFGVLPVPDSIPLPQFGIAYVRVRDAQHNLLITAQAAPGGGGAMQLATKPGTPVVLVIPALAGTGAAPTANVAFNVIYNTTTGTLASSNDSIAVSSAPGATLLTLGALGLDVERLAFKVINGAGTFVADAKLHLPAALGGADIRFANLTVSPQGFSGTATAGAYTTTPPANPQPFATATVSQGPGVAVQFNGATLTFGNGVSAKVSGQVVAPSLAATPIFFTGQFTSGSGLSLGVDVNNLTPLSIGQASFAAQQVSVGAWDTAFTVTLGGILKMPQISQDFAVTFAGLTVGTHGVQFPSSLSVTGSPQTFNLFGMTLTAQDEQVGNQSCPGLGLAYASPTITLTVSGTLQFLGKTGTFCKLSIASDGSVSIGGASLLGSTVIVDKVLTLDNLTLTTVGSSPAVSAAFSVTLPAPLGGAPSHASVTIAKDGTITGGARIPVVTANSDPSIRQFSFGDASIALREVDLVLDLTPQHNSSVQAVAAFCFQQGSCPTSSGKEIDLGSLVNNTFTAGITVGFDGAVSLGTVSVPNDITFDSSMIVLKIHAASAPPPAQAPSTSGFALNLSGQLGLNFSAVSGGITFQNFLITSAGKVQFSPSGITGGNLSIGGVVSLGFDGFVFSTKDTSVTIPTGSTPTGGADSTGSEQNTLVEVTSYLHFHGLVSVLSSPSSGGGSGGPAAFSGQARVLAYHEKTDNSFHLLVDSADFTVGNFLDMQAALRYDESPSTGWSILLGASATVMQQAGFIVVGTIGEVVQNGKTETRAGLFLAGKGLHIPIPGTPIAITGLGGGFFLNPTQADLQLVQSLCQVGQDTTKIRAQDATWAVLLYGQASIVDPNIAQGQVLITLSDAQFRIDGTVTVFGAMNIPGANVNGDVHLGFTLGNVGAEGLIDVKVDYVGVVTGGGGVGFSVYGANQWAISGNLSLNVFGEFQSDGDTLFIGPGGFYAVGDIQGGFDILFVSVTNGIRAQIWYFQGSDWGAYVTLDVSASVLDGMVSATGSLSGSLVDTDQGLLVYANAQLQVHTPVHDWTGTVWVQFQNGHSPTAGLGDDPDMDAAIAAAQQHAQDMMGESNAVAGAIAAAKATASDISIPKAELAAAYQKFAQMSFWQLLGNGLYDEYDQYEVNALAAQPAVAPYFQRYWAMLNQVGAPGDTLLIQGLATDSIPGILSRIQGGLPAVQQKLNAIQIQITPLVTSPAPPPRASPITPPTGSAAAGTLRSFTVNATVAKQNRDAATNGAAVAKAHEQQMRAQLQALEAGLVTAHAATGAADPSTLLSFVQQYDTVERMAEEQFALQADFTLRKRDWANTQLAWLESQVGVIHAAISGQTQTLLTGNVGQLNALARHRVVALTTIAPSFANDTSGWNSDWNTPNAGPRMKTWADTAGMALWYSLDSAGLATISHNADSVYRALTVTAGLRLATIRQLHRQMSHDLDSLSRTQAALTGALYDAYNAFMRWKRTQPKPSASTLPTLQASTKAALNLDDTTAVLARMAQLGQDLTVPSIASVSVSGQGASPYMTQVQFTWTGRHPTGIYEYLFNDTTAGQPLAPQLFSNGGSNSRVIYLFTPNPDHATTMPRSFQVGVRGTAGYVGYGSNPYSVAFGTPIHNVGTGTIATNGGMTADGTPPTAPYVHFPNNPSVTGLDGKARVWSNNPTSIEVAWSAYDGESGISDYDYAVVSALSTVKPAWVTAGGRADMTLGQLKLSATAPLVVDVRATNGQGLVSSLGTSAPIYYDSTPPAWPTGARLTPSGVASPPVLTTIHSVGPSCPVSPPVFPAPTSAAAPSATVSAGTTSLVAAGSGSAGATWTGSLGGTSSSSSATALPAGAVSPKLLLAWPQANDPESGVAGYFWRIDQQPDSVLDRTTWISTAMTSPTFNVGLPTVDYLHQYYVSFVAANHAAGVSTPLVYGPFQVPDPTAPTDPAFCATPASYGPDFLVQLTTAATDLETGIKGYQFRVRTAPGTATVRNWPATSTVDWPGTAGSATWTTPALSLTSGAKYYVDLRAVNGQGMTSDIIASGPILYDATPPPVAAATAAWDGTKVISLSVNAPADPESGIVGLQAAVGSSAGASDVLPWANISGAAAGPFAATLVTTSPLIVGTYYVQFRTINGAGLPSATSQTSFTVAPHALTPPGGGKPIP